jgi:hypothetical protein
MQSQSKGEASQDNNMQTKLCQSATSTLKVKAKGKGRKHLPSRHAFSLFSFVTLGSSRLVLPRPRFILKSVDTIRCIVTTMYLHGTYM